MAQLAWREVVARAFDALHAQGFASISLGDIYAEVERQNLRPRGPSWKPKVRQQLQVLRKRDHRISTDEAGEFHEAPPLPSQEVLDTLIRHCEAEFVIESSRYEEKRNAFHGHWFDHIYELRFAPPVIDEDLGILDPADPSVLESATAALAKWYHRETGVNVQLAALDEDGEEREPATQEGWVNLAYAESPTVAAGQLVFELEEYSKDERYRFDFITAIAWVLREPKQQETERVKRKAQRERVARKRGKGKSKGKGKARHSR